MRGIQNRNMIASGEQPFILEPTAQVFRLERKVIDNTSAVVTMVDEFQGPPAVQAGLPAEDNPSRVAGLPVYLGPDGSFYDIDYNRVKDGPNDARRLSDESGLTAEMKDVYDTEAIASHQPSGEGTLGDLYRSFPDPAHCTSYEDLEGRLVKWREDMERSLGYVVVPRVMGRCYCRPKVSTHRTDEEAAATTTTTTTANAGAPGEDGEGDIQLHRLNGDPWEATLIPPEPDPHFYEDYDQYELAMKRWYEVCISGSGHGGLTRMLPHPSQLPKMQTLKIQPAKEVFSFAHNLSADDAAAKAADSFTFVGIVPGYKNPYARDPVAAAAARTLPPSPALPGKKALAAARRFRASLVAAPPEADGKDGSDGDVPPPPKKEGNVTEGENIPPPPIPPPPSKGESAPKGPQREQTEEEAADLAAQKEFGAALDRMLAQAEQNSGEYGVSNRPVAVVQLAEKYDTHVDLKKLEDTLVNPQQSKYPEQEREEYERLQNAWKVRERAALVEDTDASRSTFFNLLRDKTAVAGPARVAQAVKVSMSFEGFRRILESKPAESRGMTVYSTLAAEVPQSEFPTLLAQWELMQDPAALEKFAFFVCEMVKRNPDCARSFLMAPPSHATCSGLYTIARCIYFSNPAQPDVYPFNEETFTLLEQAFFSEAQTINLPQPQLCTEVVLNIFVWYYLGLINAGIKQDAVFAAFSAREKAVAAALRSTPKIVVVLFHCLAHRSVTISNASLVAVTRLLHSDNKDITETLAGATANLCEELQVLCFSKLSHVQFAIRRITDILLTLSWRQTLFGHFGPGRRLLIPFAVLGSYGNSGVTQTYAEFVERIYTTGYASAPDASAATRHSWAFGTETFNDISNGIGECIRVRLYYGAAALARVLERLCLASFKLKVIASEGTGSSSMLALTVSQDTIDTLFRYINDLSKSPDAAAYPVCAPILSATRILLRNQDVYAEHRAKEKLIQNLLVFCKDGRDSDFNKQAWKLFYELIEYHAGAIELMENTSLLSQFADVLGTTVNGTTVTIHSIRYFRKILELYSAEQKRHTILRDDGKSVEKDVKFFTNFFKDRHLFVKFHMTYKNQASMCGAVFYEVAQLYQKLQILPETQKLLKDIQKNPEYKKGLQDIHEMFPPN